MDNIKKYREKRGLSTKDIAKILGISETSYINMEELEMSIDLKTLIRLAKIYNASLDEIVGRKPIPRSFVPFSSSHLGFISIGYSDGHQTNFQITDAQADALQHLVVCLLNSHGSSHE